MKKSEQKKEKSRKTNILLRNYLYSAGLACWAVFW